MYADNLDYIIDNHVSFNFLYNQLDNIMYAKKINRQQK